MKYEVNGASVTVQEDETLVAGSIKVHRAEFVFDESWCEYVTKKAVFKAENITIEMLLENDVCEIPWEVLQKCGTLDVGVYGENGEKCRPTLWAPRKNINPGATNGGTSRNPTPNIWRQLISMLFDVAPHIGKNGDWYVGDVDTGTPAQGPRGEDGDDYVLTDADKDEIAAEAAKYTIGKQLILTPDMWVDDSDIKLVMSGAPYKYVRVGYHATADNKGGAMLTSGAGITARNEWQTVNIEFTLASDIEAFGLYFTGGADMKYIQPYDVMGVKVYAANDAKKRNLFSDDIEEQFWVTNNADTKRAIAMSDGIKFMHVFRQAYNYVQLRSTQKIPLAAGTYVFECRIRLSPWLYHYVAPFYDAHSEYSLTVSPARDSAVVYNEYGVHCAAFGNYSVIFGCDAIPGEDISVNAMIHKASGDAGMIFQPTHGPNSSAYSVMTLEEPVAADESEEVTT